MLNVNITANVWHCPVTMVQHNTNKNEFDEKIYVLRIELEEIYVNIDKYVDIRDYMPITI